jgi:histidine triad (HIT) family protein
MAVAACIFCQIVAGTASARVVYRDELVVAFRDINGVAPTHILIVPAQHVESLLQLRTEDEGLLRRLFDVAQKLAADEKIDATGYRVVVNTGSDAGQSVFHLHLHLLGGRRLHWPPG